MSDVQKDQPNYKTLNQELEQIIEELQSNDLDIDRLLVEYERGVDVIDKLEKYLNEAENRVKRITTKARKA